MTKDEALTLAFEALKENQHLVADNQPHAYVMEYNSIIEKCEEALAQSKEPEQEPATKEQIREAMIFNLPLYTTPPQPKEPKQEPIAYFNPQVKGGFYWAKPTKITAPITVSVEPMPLYTTPPQRTWVGLTDEEIDELHGSPMDLEHSSALKWVRIIEAKLKEKNT